MNDGFIKTQRLGCNVFIGKSVSELREAMLNCATIVIAISGGVKAMDEILEAERKGILVIPIGMSEGTASQIWMQKKLENSFCYPHYIEDLNNRNPFIVVNSIMEILKLRFLLRAPINKKVRPRPDFTVSLGRNNLIPVVSAATAAAASAAATITIESTTTAASATVKSATTTFATEASLLESATTTGTVFWTRL